METELSVLIQNTNLGGSERQQLPQLLNATEKLTHDRPTEPVDAVFFFGRSFFDAERRGLFQLAVDYINDGRAGYIVIPERKVRN
jgi:hypothetical protein